VHIKNATLILSRTEFFLILLDYFINLIRLLYFIISLKIKNVFCVTYSEIFQYVKEKEKERGRETDFILIFITYIQLFSCKVEYEYICYWNIYAPPNFQRINETGIASKLILCVFTHDTRALNVRFEGC